MATVSYDVDADKCYTITTFLLEAKMKLDNDGFGVLCEQSVIPSW